MIDWPIHCSVKTAKGKKILLHHATPQEQLRTKNKIFKNGVVIVDTQNDFMDIDVTLGDIIQWSDDKYIIVMVEKSVLVSVEELPMYLGIHSVLDAKIAEILAIPKGGFLEKT